MAEITEEAFERCGLELRTGYDAATARRSLNILFAEWANRGLNMWTVEQITQPLAQLSSSSSIATYPIGTITLTVAATASFTVGETITGGTSASTASIITKATSTTLTVTVPTGDFTPTETITGSSSAASTTVTSNFSLADAQSTVDVLEVVVRRSGSDIGITRIGRSDYIALSNKTTQGKASQFYVNRQITPTITLWATPENSTDELIYYRVRRIQDADTATNDADIPFRFLPCLTAGLSYYLSIKKAPDRIGMLKDLYEEEFQRAASEDGERTALRLVPSYSSLSVS
tara:strand:+ start:89 stop:955 length:867 start_codon:yes stop_codon:yes gene_type:complete